MDCEKINDKIDNDISYEIIDKISDTSLISEFLHTKSVNNRIDQLRNVLNKYIDNNLDPRSLLRDNIILDYLPYIIPPGTKGVIRGNKFNKIVREYITNLNLDTSRFEIAFEKQYCRNKTSEIPDWYIFDNETNKLIIGMNQLDLWSGGQQLNRGIKYMCDTDHNSDTCKLLCVVCNYTQVKPNTKAYKIFKIGFDNDTLCYINRIGDIIDKFFC